MTSPVYRKRRSRQKRQREEEKECGRCISDHSLRFTHADTCAFFQRFSLTRFHAERSSPGDLSASASPLQNRFYNAKP